MWQERFRERFRQNSDAPFVKFPQNPEITEYLGHKVLSYVSPEQMEIYWAALSKKINLSEFPYAIVNLKGAVYSYEKICSLQGCWPKAIFVEYHRSENGHGAHVVRPVPDKYKNVRCLIIDDVYDTGGVLRAIKKDARNSSVVVAVKKRVPKQIQIRNLSYAVEVENYWLGGVGMDFGKENYQEDYPRDHKGIVVLPPT